MPAPQPDVSDQIAMLPAIAQLNPMECAERFDVLANRSVTQSPEQRTTLIDTGLQLQIIFSHLTAQQTGHMAAACHRERGHDVLRAMQGIEQTPPSRLRTIERGSRALPRVTLNDLDLGANLATFLLHTADIDPNTEAVKARELFTQPNHDRTGKNTYHLVVFGETPATSSSRIFVFHQGAELIYHFKGPLPEIRRELAYYKRPNRKKDPDEKYREDFVRAHAFTVEAGRALPKRNQFPTLLELATRRLTKATAPANA